LLKNLKDMLMDATFPEDEFQKYKNQILAYVSESKASPSSLADNLMRKAIYGAEHPYSFDHSDKSVAKQELKEVLSYYKETFIPNNIIIAVTGDVKANDVFKKLENLFKDWKKFEILLDLSVPKPTQSPAGVYFISRPGSVQSAVFLGRKNISYNESEYMPMYIATGLLTGAFTSRLTQSLREKYAFLYSPTGRLSAYSKYNYYYCGGEVKTSATDSTILVIKEELRRLNNESVPEKELNTLKKYLAGMYNLNFEDANFAARIVLNSFTREVTPDYMKTFTNRILSVNSNQVFKVSREYLNPDEMFVVVVGDPSIKESLSKYGNVFEYDNEINPVMEKKIEKISMTTDELFEKYEKALGGKENIGKIKTLIVEGNVVMQNMGQNFTGTIASAKVHGEKVHQLLDLKVYMQESWLEDKKGWELASGMMRQLEGEEYDNLVYQSHIIPELELRKLGYKCQVLGKIGNEILLETEKDGKKATMFFDDKTFLHLRTEAVQDGVSGPQLVKIITAEYTDVQGVKFPAVSKIQTDNLFLSYEYKYIINPTFKEDEFQKKE